MSFISQIEQSKNALTWLVVVVVLSTFISYLPSLKNDFTEWDDDKYVTKNELIRDFSVQNFKKIFQTPEVMGNYHPLTIISLSFDYVRGELNPKTYHWHNLILHLLNTTLLFFLILQLTRNKIIAFVTSLLFGIHPMHVESVAWISERKDVLYTFFFFSSMLAYLRYLNSDKNTGFYLLTLFLFILSILSKGQAVVLPVALLLVDYFSERKWHWNWITEKIPFFAVSFISGLAALKAQKAAEAVAAPETFTIFERFLFATYGTTIYLIKAIVPFKLSHFHPYPSYVDDAEKILPTILYVSPIILILLGAVIFFTYKKTKVYTFGILFFFVTIALVLQFLPVGRAIIAERYTYIPYVGFFLIIGYLINQGLKSPHPKLSALKSIVPLIFISVSAYYAYSTYERSQVWKNEVSIWTDYIKKYPKKIDGYQFRGNYYAKHGQNDLALKDFNTWINLQQNMDEAAKAYNARGKVYGQLKQFNKSIADFNQAEKLYPKLQETYINRALTLCIAGRAPESFSDFDKALDLSKENKKLYIYQNRARAYFQTGNFNKALNDYNEVLRRKPNDFSAWLDRGKIHLNMNNYPNAVQDFSKVLQFQPQNKEAYGYRAIANARIGKNAEAKKDAQKAQQLGFQYNEDALAELGLI